MDEVTEEETEQPGSDTNTQAATLSSLRGHGQCRDFACAGCAGCKARETTIPKRIGRRPPANKEDQIGPEGLANKLRSSKVEKYQRLRLHRRKPTLADPLSKYYPYRQTFFSAKKSLLSMTRKADDASDEQTDNDSESEDTPKVERFLAEERMERMRLRRRKKTKQ
jgi:hypothetical protein